DDKKSNMTNGIEVIPRLEKKEQMKLSFSQQRLWFLQQLDPKDVSYNISLSFEILGLLEIASLEKSVNLLLKRHESLRTTFEIVEGEPVQKVEEFNEIKLPIHDVESTVEAKKVSENLSREPFDLENGPLYRLQLLKVNEEHYVLSVTIHHIISDGWSMGIIAEEISNNYKKIKSNKHFIQS
ncbi:condensation domain-containing protein, partial [Halomonas sp. THAF12]|uniref:condensation domain-containing protein n=1 Tax=Halomonas sp. B23F22_10 TaxID=3459515 RepID=UPI00373E777F